MTYLFARLAGMAALLTAAAPAALAQNVSNQAWIGQTGDTNTITVIQTGIGNAAGANAAALEINQGDSGTSNAHYNTLVIDQFGWNNKAGAIELGDPDAPRGINQLGDRNTAKVSQKNGSADAANSVGAIYQWSRTGLAAVANSLDIEQSVLGDNSASHSIGYVSQTNDSDDLGANIVELFQSGGLAGVGNAIERVMQRGYGNFAKVVQNLQQNTVGSARQIGNRNELVALQGEGETNTVANVAQIGDLNHALISQSGDRNYVASVYQNNEGIAKLGNTLAVTLAGNNNGGDETGGLGGFKTDEANAVSVYQGTFSQIGDDNDISFTVNGGDENLFGVSQTGDGNGAIIAIGRSTGQAATTYASKNETAVVQTGDGNAMSATIVGNKNAVGTTFDGDRNALSLEQTGDGNKISVSIFGNDNNNSTLPSVGGFTGEPRILAVSLGLTPGQGLQSGNSNRAVANVFNGDRNLFAFNQHGDRNTANFDLSGTSNQSLVSQAGDANSAQIKQSGTSNSMAISQF